MFSDRVLPIEAGSPSSSKKEKKKRTSDSIDSPPLVSKGVYSLDVRSKAVSTTNTTRTTSNSMSAPAAAATAAAAAAAAGDVLVHIYLGVIAWPGVASLRLCMRAEKRWGASSSIPEKYT